MDSDTLRVDADIFESEKKNSDTRGLKFRSHVVVLKSSEKKWTKMCAKKINFALSGLFHVVHVVKYGPLIILKINWFEVFQNIDINVRVCMHPLSSNSMISHR